jgi:hypothetical protein
MRLVVPRIPLVMVSLALATLFGVEVGRAQGQETVFSIDVNPDSRGIQASRSVPIGETFETDVVLVQLAASAYTAYQVRVGFDDAVLRPVGLPDDWARAPAKGESGNIAEFPHGVNCVPGPGDLAYHPDNTGDGRGHLYMGCVDVGVSPIETLQPLVRFAFVCLEAGTAELTAPLGPTGSHILGEDWEEYWDASNEATVTCVENGSVAAASEAGGLSVIAYTLGIGGAVLVIMLAVVGVSMARRRLAA